MKTLATALLLLATPAAGQDGTPPDVRAWQQVDPYVAPDLEGYFPDDPAGGQALDELIDQNRLRSLGDVEYIEAVRRGLRHTTNHRTTILAGLGKRFVWGVDPQNADAIELCYHAADFSEAAETYGGTRHYAVYFGLSVVTEKTPAILRTLADLCVAIDDPNDIGRVAWGAASQMDELLPYLEPHLASEDEYVRKKAADVRRIFLGEIAAFEWGKRRMQEPPRPKPWKEMPEVRAALRDGDSAARLAMLERIRAEDLTKDMNDSYVADFAAAATDPDPEVRKQVAITVGNAWIWRAGWHSISREASDLALRLSRDDDEDVRYQAVYYGLSTYHGEDDAVPRRMIEMLMDPAEARSRRRMIWGLGKHTESAARILDEDLRGADAARARAAYDLHWELFEKAPAIVPPGIAQPPDLVGTWHIGVEAPALQHGRTLQFTVTQGEDGRLTVGIGDERERLEEVLKDFLSTAAGQVLHFDFRVEFEGGDLHVSGRLEEERLAGTLRIGGGDTLFVWSGKRAPGK